MNLTALNAFDDNYIWMIDNGREALVVDPGDAAPVLDALAHRSLTLTAILVTHHHGDHVGGLDAILAQHPAQVFGPARERMPVPVHPVHDGDHVKVLGLDWQVLDVPGHTAGHVAYFCDAHQTPNTGKERTPPVLFCGDTLFSGGCGRLFEGTASQMHASLLRLAALPSDTRVCCAHEYTLANLRFALAVDPCNQALIDYQQHCLQVRERHESTLPATLGVELQVNPFLRCQDAAVREAAQSRDPLATTPEDVFATLRQWKNNFR